MRRWITTLMLLAALACPLWAGMPPTRAQVLLTQCPSHESLRASLLEYAHGAPRAERLPAGEAMFYAGLSYERAGRADSAIACYRGAIERRGNNAERLALADALLRRARPDDLAAARALLDSTWARANLEGDQQAQAYQARLAWLELVSGEAARAVERFAPLEATDPGLVQRPLWRYRLARAYLEAGDARRAFDIGEPLGVTSRAQDEAVLALLDRSEQALGGKGRVAEQLGRAIAAHDESERAALATWGGRRIRFVASDGFALGGTARAASGTSRRSAVVVLCEPGDTLASYDTLAVALARAGHAVLLMDVRGSGWSVGPTCPFADTWAGREDAMHTRVAQDVRSGLRALALVAPTDTSRYVVAGVGRTASVAVEAATLDARVRALLLLSPNPAPVDRGLMRARIARLQRPAYFSSAPEDFPQFELTDALYQAGNRARSRVADTRAAGHGAQALRGDHAAVERLIQWLEELPPAGATPAPRPAAPRRG